MCPTFELTEINNLFQKTKKKKIYFDSIEANAGAYMMYKIVNDNSKNIGYNQDHLDKNIGLVFSY